MLEASSGNDHSWRTWLFALATLATTLISRIALLSEPYFADGPFLVTRISQGKVFIQPPGYFLFMFLARSLTTVGFSAATAISIINIGLNLAGVFVFIKICERLLPGMTGRLLSLCYAFMNVVWFSAEVHSTYATMTFWGPALFYCVIRDDVRWFLTGCGVWALGAGFRPSDGVFLFPMLVMGATRYSWRQRACGAAIVTLFGLVWWLPNAEYYGGFLGPIRASVSQAARVSQDVSLLRAGLTGRALANALRFVLALVTSLNVLLPLALLGMWRQFNGIHTKLLLAWVLPGAAFFSLIYMSDALYIAYMAGGLLLLAGFASLQLRPKWAINWLVVCLGVSFIQMLVLRPVAPSSFVRRVANAYSLEYSAWGLKNRYHKNLADLERETEERSGESGPGARRLPALPSPRSRPRRTACATC